MRCAAFIRDRGNGPLGRAAIARRGRSFAGRTACRSNGGAGFRNGAPATNGGFTLVESVVSLLIVGIVLAAVAAVLVFGSNMMAHQRAVSNAQTIASTVKTSLEGALEPAQNVSAAGTGDDIAITFTTTDATPYLGNKGATYVLTVHNDDGAAGAGASGSGDGGASPQPGGHVYVALANDESSAGELVPASTYIDGDTVALSATGKQVTVTVYSHEGAELAQATTEEVLTDAAAPAGEGGEA